MLKLEEVKKGKKYIDNEGFIKTVLFVGKQVIVYEYKGLSCTPDAMYETAVCINSFLINHSTLRKKKSNATK